MTDDEVLLARLQVEREQRMARWNVPSPKPRRLPIKPRRLLDGEAA